ncbi:hypothetical protein PGB90_010601 [Kerria lacca]
MQLMRNLDFNPNKHYLLATCGDDERSRFWDIRNSEQSLISLNDHSYWVQAICYNQYHNNCDCQQ